MEELTVNSGNPPNDQIPDIVPPPPVNPPVKNALHNKIFSVIFVTIALILTATLSFTIRINTLRKTAKIANKQISIQTNENSENILKVKKYENGSLGFSLEYPENLKVDEKINEGDKYVNFIPLESEEPVFNVEIPKDLHPIKAYEFYLLGSRDIINEKDITIDGIKGKMMVNKYLYAKDKSRVDYSQAIISNGKTYVFSGISRNLDTSESAVFDKIISTIKFASHGINKFEELPDTSTWLKYSNPDSEYSLKYPPEWKIEETKLPFKAENNRLSYTSFTDSDFLYNLRVEVFQISELSNIYKNNDVENCSPYEENVVTLKSGKQLNYAKCQYYNKYILQFPEKNRLFTVISNKGVFNPPVVDSFLSSISPT